MLSSSLSLLLIIIIIIVISITIITIIIITLTFSSLVQEGTAGATRLTLLQTPSTLDRGRVSTTAEAGEKRVI